ncbi:hypothetical protein FNB79_13760 [Formosa sediminum]|uniref:Uncharacterized protein n=1 Tax=Formosa sediminum TaxID=2594004 RepID=A0A516GUD5_9FLAO|nr:hypothetical protein [Formosa sediminum]QDO94990.1 hypothetical protein FNB79_13760 [Formosa sediminum]
MKSIYIALVILLGYSSTQAQTVTKDVLDETKTITTKTNNGKEIKENTIEINRRVEQDVKLDEADKNKLNQNRANTEAQVQETIKITNNSPFTANKKSMVYKLDDKTMEFKMNDDGFSILNHANSDMTTVKQSEGDTSQFVMKDNGETGIGYFDEQGNFVVQKFDKKSNQIVSKTYQLVE